MPPRYLADTNCLVAAMCDWHEHHEVTLREIRRRERAGEELIVASHSLFEAYAVLTRLPDPYAIEPGVALSLIEDNWGTATVIALGTAESRSLLRKSCDEGLRGGQIYDAIIAACATKGGAATILTLNVRHFARWSAVLEVAVPRPDGRASG